MLPFKTIKRHATLVDRMATTRGIDLEVAVLRGDLEIEDISEAVLRCTACSNPVHCDHWLTAQKRIASDSPGFCRNAQLFAKLAPKAE